MFTVHNVLLIVLGWRCPLYTLVAMEYLARPLLYNTVRMNHFYAKTFHFRKISTQYVCTCCLKTVSLNR